MSKSATIVNSGGVSKVLELPLKDEEIEGFKGRAKC